MLKFKIRLLGAVCFLALLAACATVQAPSGTEPVTDVAIYDEYCRPTECDDPAKVLKRYAPEYPYYLAIRNISGEATLSFVINEQDRSEDFEVVDATHAEFADASRRVLGKWEFEPAKLNGTPVPVRVEQTITYRLTKSPE